MKVISNNECLRISGGLINENYDTCWGGYLPSSGRCYSVNSYKDCDELLQDVSLIENHVSGRCNLGIMHLLHYGLEKLKCEIPYSTLTDAQMGCINNWRANNPGTLV